MRVGYGASYAAPGGGGRRRGGGRAPSRRRRRAARRAAVERHGRRPAVGPPLAGIASRSYIAGVLTNDPQHMIRWIVDPKGVDSLTAMPVTGVSEGEARDIAAYLYTLR